MLPIYAVHLRILSRNWACEKVSITSPWGREES